MTIPLNSSKRYRRSPLEAQLRQIVKWSGGSKNRIRKMFVALKPCIDGLSLRRDFMVRSSKKLLSSNKNLWEGPIWYALQYHEELIAKSNEMNLRIITSTCGQDVTSISTASKCDYVTNNMLSCWHAFLTCYSYLEKTFFSFLTCY